MKTPIKRHGMQVSAKTCSLSKIWTVSVYGLVLVISLGAFSFSQAQTPQPPANGDHNAWVNYIKQLDEYNRKADLKMDPEAYLALLAEVKTLPQARELFDQYFHSSLIEYTRKTDKGFYQEDLEKFFKKIQIPAKLASQHRMLEQAALEYLAVLVTRNNISGRQALFEKALVFLYVTSDPKPMPFGVQVNDNQMLISTLATIHNLEGNSSGHYFGLVSNNMTTVVLERFALRFYPSNVDQLNSSCDTESRAIIWLRKFSFKEKCQYGAPFWDQNGRVMMKSIFSEYDSDDGDSKRGHFGSGIDAIWEREPKGSRSFREILKSYSKSFFVRK